MAIKKKIGEYMLRSFEQEVCNLSIMHSNQNKKIIYWYMKIDPTMWIAADFEWTNVALKSASENISMEKLFSSQPVALSYNIFKNSDYDN